MILGTDREALLVGEANQSTRFWTPTDGIRRRDLSRIEYRGGGHRLDRFERKVAGVVQRVVRGVLRSTDPRDQ